MSACTSAAVALAAALFTSSSALAGGFTPEGSYVGHIDKAGCGKITVYKSGGLKYLGYNCQTFKTYFKAKRTIRVGNTIYVDAAKIEGAKVVGDCIVGRWKHKEQNEPIRLCRIKCFVGREVFLNGGSRARNPKFACK